MSEEILNHTICLKQYISEKEYCEINQLEKICYSQDKTNLKLELEYRMNTRRNTDSALKDINEFLYYIDDVLVSYLSITSFGGSNTGEINGMTHPGFRRKGLFHKLFECAISECQKRKFTRVLLLSEGKSDSGIEFIKAVHGEYEFSEYRMKLQNKTESQGIDLIKLRKSTSEDAKEIARQNAIFFYGTDDCESFPEEEPIENEVTYMVELENKTIGKIRVDYNDNSAFICGFGLLPSFRGKGYGKAALKAAIKLLNEKNIFNIELDVECKNDTALNLYKGCGFEEKSVMSYYII